MTENSLLFYVMLPQNVIYKDNTIGMLTDYMDIVKDK